ncbi:MAG: hypothetical protein CFE21_09865 [Bacteroidetes bacterium B1(2017)]|nr:MAG: hypothetical protein CFE21_09865 [Bacteroidetes bacterium B1(2017)]
MKKILVADNELMNQFYLKKLCDSPDVLVMTANNGQEAVNLCEVHKFDLIFMDIQMPVMNGTEALIQIRNIESDVFHRTPIIAISSDFGLYESTIKEFDFDEMILNPLQVATVKEIIKKYLMV